MLDIISHTLLEYLFDLSRQNNPNDCNQDVYFCEGFWKGLTLFLQDFTGQSGICLTYTNAHIDIFTYSYQKRESKHHAQSQKINDQRRR